MLRTGHSMSSALFHLEGPEFSRNWAWCVALTAAGLGRDHRDDVGQGAETETFSNFLVPLFLGNFLELCRHSEENFLCNFRKWDVGSCSIDLGPHSRFQMAFPSWTPQEWKKWGWTVWILGHGPRFQSTSPMHTKQRVQRVQPHRWGFTTGGKEQNLEFLARSQKCSGQTRIARTIPLERYPTYPNLEDFDFEPEVEPGKTWRRWCSWLTLSWTTGSGNAIWSTKKTVVALSQTPLKGLIWWHDFLKFLTLGID